MQLSHQYHPNRSALKDNNLSQRRALSDNTNIATNVSYRFKLRLTDIFPIANRHGSRESAGYDGRTLHGHCRGQHMTTRAELTHLDSQIEELRRFEQDYRLRLRMFHQQQLDDLDPESGTVTLPRLPSDQRKQLIEWLAKQVIEDGTADWPAGVIPYLLTLWGTQAIRGGVLDRAFVTYVDAERRRRGLDAGQSSRPSIVPLLRDSAARNASVRRELDEQAARALAIVVHGGPTADGLASALDSVFPD